jgi:hypothetical protein
MGRSATSTPQAEHFQVFCLGIWLIWRWQVPLSTGCRKIRFACRRNGLAASFQPPVQRGLRVMEAGAVTMTARGAAFASDQLVRGPSSRGCWRKRLRLGSWGKPTRSLQRCALAPGCGAIYRRTRPRDPLIETSRPRRRVRRRPPSSGEARPRCGMSSLRSTERASLTVG